MESAQHTEGSSPSTSSFGHNNLAPPSTQSRRQSRSRSQPRQRRAPSSRLPPDSGDLRSISEGSDRELGSDVEELGRFPPTPPRQTRQRTGRRDNSSNQRAAPAPSMPSQDEHLVEPIPRRPAIPVRRSAPRRIPLIGETNASDTDTTSSSSSSGPPPIRRRPLRTRTEMDLSLRGPMLEKSADGTIVPPGKEFGPDYDGRRPLPPRTRNPRDILNDGERGFIVDLKMNIEVEIQLKAAIMGDLTLSVL
ncbi:hypothetical protein C8034_v005196 [Colletotrichum sidae]|uniref:Uncharacterized protein n=1 Tax=Colletotrichum sidae TaxID=1347389 RepID=A0A4R8TVD2_9PEZI|nr:hypothetical protein C8034_v005196 [Colletotrichum sidae]